MRILYLTSQYPAPSHTFIRREVRSLRRQGLNIQTASIRRPGTHELLGHGDTEEANLTFYVLPPKPVAIVKALVWALKDHPGATWRTLKLAFTHRVPGLRAMLWAVFYFVEAIYLAQHARGAEIAHVHNHFANPAATVGLLVTRFLGLSWSLTLHGISEFDYPAGVLLPEKLKAADFVACVSHFGKAQAMRMCPPHHWHKFQIVRCGIDPQVLKAPAPQNDSDQKSDQKPDSPRIVSVGRLSPEKGFLGCFALSTVCPRKG